jgi:PLP dependent protein
MTTETIAENLADVRRRIAAAELRARRAPGSVQLVAVSKTFPPPPILEAYQAGQRHFGENRIQEFEGKVAHMQWEGAVWHMIGHIQSNKAARAAQLFDVVHTVDSVSLARRLNDQRAKARKQPLAVFIEVKLSDEAAKTGAAETDVDALAAEIRRMDHLDLRGVMTIPPWSLDPEVARPYFRRLRGIGSRVGVQELSMGMTNDFETAVEEGATVVRVGTAIFGKRTKQGPETSEG